jgi:hypothetical protein
MLPLKLCDHLEQLGADLGRHAVVNTQRHRKASRREQLTTLVDRLAQLQLTGCGGEAGALPYAPSPASNGT